jgi:hypothetical protein
MNESCNLFGEMALEHRSMFRQSIGILRSEYIQIVVEVPVAHFTIQGVSPRRDIDYQAFGTFRPDITVYIDFPFGRTDEGFSLNQALLSALRGTSVHAKARR